MKNQPNHPPVITASVRLYAALLILYPASFRRDYGAHMVQVFGDVTGEQYHRRGTAGIIIWWCSTLVDLIVTAIEQRKKGTFAMSTLLPVHPTKGSGLGVLCLLGGFLYAVGGLWLLSAGLPSDSYGIQVTHVIKLMWAGGATCGLMGLVVTGALMDEPLAHIGGWLSVVGLVITTLEALVAIVMRYSVAAFTDLPLPLSGIPLVIVLVGWSLVSVLVLRTNGWKNWSRFAPLVIGLSPFVGLLLGSLFGHRFLTIIIMAFGLLVLGAAVQVNLAEKRRNAQTASVVA